MIVQESKSQAPEVWHRKIDRAMARIVAPVLALVLIGGCDTKPRMQFGKPEIVLELPTVSTGTEGAVALRRFHYGGVYQITGFSRYGGARNLAPGAILEDFTFADGGIKVRLSPVPYGVKVEIANQLDETIEIDGSRCSLIDAYGAIHAIELRSPTALYPEATPSRQILPLAPDTMFVIDFDVITPEYRSRILETAPNFEARGAYIVSNAPLPIFCSGYYLPASARPDFARVRQWAIFKTFGLHLFISRGGEPYEYRLMFTPSRFSSGPRESPEWGSTHPSDLAGYERFGRPAR